jgi:hypothetical protein
MLSATTKVKIDGPVPNIKSHSTVMYCVPHRYQSCEDGSRPPAVWPLRKAEVEWASVCAMTQVWMREEPWR